MLRYIKGKPGIQMPRETGLAWGGWAALHWMVLTCSRTNSPCKRQQSNGSNCTAASCYRILICADDATNMLWKSDRLLWRTWVTLLSAEFSEKQKLQTRRAWRHPIRFSVYLPAVQKDPDLHPSHRCLPNCTGNLLQSPPDPSPSDFSAWRF